MNSFAFFCLVLLQYAPASKFNAKRLHLLLTYTYTDLQTLVACFFSRPSTCNIISVQSKLTLTLRGSRGGTCSPPWGTFFHNSRTAKAFHFKFWHSAWNLSGSVCAKFQGHMTPTDDVITYFWEAPPQKMVILVYFLNFNNSFDTDGITTKLCKTLNNTSN